jgi:4-amino-4-deoxy-L-arabinose transferase-like glycosyltransferase
MRGPPERAVLFIPIWLVWITALGFVLGGLGSFGILDNNEGLYAEIAREMLAAHDWRQWVIPHLNGLPYMEKPPLLYWLTALSFALFGESEWSARAVPALSALACVAMLVRFGVAVKRPQAGRLAALMFVSGVGVSAMSHLLMFDMLLTALLTAALMCAYGYLIGGSARFVRCAYGCLALALLAKGFVALVLFGLVIAGFMLATQRSITALWHACGKWLEPSGILIFFAIAAPWHLAASLVEPAFPWFYFINEHVLRFLGKREPHDYYGGGWWYYLPRMALYLFPWSFLLPCLLAPVQRPADQDGARLQRFLWLAWLAPLIFFSVSSAKANYYLVAAMPFAAFHLAAAIENRGILNGPIRAVPGLLIGTLSLGLCIALALRAEESHQTLTIVGLSQRQFSIWLSGGIALLAFGSALVAWRQVRLGLLAYLALPVCTAAALTLVLMAVEPLISTRQLAQYLRSELAGRSVYLFRNFEEQSSLPFYLKKPIPVIDSRSNDLFWGNKLRANDIVISADRFDQRMQSESVAVVVVDRQLEDFKATHFFNRFTGEKRIGETSVFFN